MRASFPPCVAIATSGELARFTYDLLIMSINKNFIASLAITLFIATLFWSQSRVPALSEKAQTGDRTNLSAIAVDIIYPTNPTQSYPERVIKTAVNWSYTNWKGMTFGLLFGAAFLSLLQGLRRPQIGSNRFIRSLGGLFLGVPLGVCVNCATPIAYAMFRSGVRLEFALAMLLSSPTLNIIVVTMAFSLLPFHIALMKLITSVIVIVFLLPLVVRLSSSSIKNIESASETLSSLSDITPAGTNEQCTLPPASQTWREAFSGALKSFWSSLRFIVQYTLPLMVVAGLLGSALVEALPAGDLSTLSITPLTILIFAIIGTFLPVPIAFDVLATNALIIGGLQVGLAGTLLFSLGIFSIYPALIIAKNLSVKLSASLFLSVILVAIVFGYAVEKVDSNINRVASSRVSDGLINSKVLEDIQSVLSECEKFKREEGGKQACLNAFQLSDVFADVNNTDCLSLVDSKGDVTSEANVFCKDVVTLHEVQKTAISEQNIKHCQTLPHSELAASCVRDYIKENAVEMSSIKICDELSGIDFQGDCRNNLVEARLFMATAEACQIGLMREDSTACFDRLNGRIAAEFENLQTCGLLTSKNAQRHCKQNVLLNKILRLHDYGVCDQLADSALSQNCEQMVLSDRALQENNPDLCEGMPYEGQQLHCRIGILVQNVSRQQQEKKLAEFKNNKPALSPAALPVMSRQTSSTVPHVLLSWNNFYERDGIEIKFVEHYERHLESGTVFRQVSPLETGLTAAWTFNLSDVLEPFKMGKGVASGDFNNDGLPDLVFASEMGARVYENSGDGHFFEHALLTPSQFDSNGFVVTFVDIDDDGWQDIFLSSYGGANYFFKNENGKFSTDRIIRLKSDKHIVTLSAGFSDWDTDGDLDFVLGNWSYGMEKGFIPSRSENNHYINDGNRFSLKVTDEILGDSLSVLMSDVNNDRAIDLFIANDRQYPDVIYYGDGSGGFDKILNKQGIIPQTSLNNMSYESADFNNDLLLDIFSADMSFGPGEDRSYCDFMQSESDNNRCKWLLEGIEAVNDINVAWCSTLEGENSQECFTIMAIEIAKRGNNETLCAKISLEFSGKRQLCRNLTQKTANYSPENFNSSIPQKQSNHLLLNSLDGKFINATEAMGVSSSYWSWNAKAADLDNDGWQDIYVGNGFDFGVGERGLHSNVFYHNQKGQNFSQQEKSFGLTGHGNTPSYTYLDFDLDGDVDIVATNVMTSPSVYLNQATKGSSISFVLRDHIGNRFCIGCKIIIEYNDKTQQQIRELKLSGGFMSFDDPVMYFGIGDESHIDSVTVIWSTGEKMTIEQNFNGNRRYKIIRHPLADS